jgi:hypothetical protein
LEPLLFEQRFEGSSFASRCLNIPEASRDISTRRGFAGPLEASEGEEKVWVCLVDFLGNGQVSRCVHASFGDGVRYAGELPIANVGSNKFSGLEALAQQHGGGVHVRACEG